MKTIKRLLTSALILSLALITFNVASLTVSAAPAASCTVTVTEQNAGTDDYCVLADATFESNTEFTAGLFSVEAADLTLNDCTVKNCTGGEAPEVQFDTTKNKVIFTGFSKSGENDFRSYTSVTLTLKFTVNAQVEPYAFKVSVKNIKIANIDEVIFSTANAQGILEIQHTHTVGDWIVDAAEHWHVCEGCAAVVDKAAHTAGEWVNDVEATAEAAGHKYKACTVCGRILIEEEIPQLTTHIPGDVNKDGKLNNKDLTRLFQYLSDWDVEVDETALDINNDGKVNNKDLTRLFQYLSDWDVEIF